MWIALIIVIVGMVVVYFAHEEVKEVKARKKRMQVVPAHYPIAEKVLDAMERKEASIENVESKKKKNFDWGFFEVFIADLQSKYLAITEDTSYEIFEAVEMVKKNKELVAANSC